MTVEFTWTVADLQRNLADGMITTVHWRVDAFDGTYAKAPMAPLAWNLQKPIP